MSAESVKTVHRVTFDKKAPQPEAPDDRVPRIARLLALAHKIDRMIERGEIRDYADAASLCDITRARMTQIMNLLLLAPDIQEAILDRPPVTTGRDPVNERQLRSIVAELDWEVQRRLSTQVHL